MKQKKLLIACTLLMPLIALAQVPDSVGSSQDSVPDTEWLTPHAPDSIVLMVPYAELVTQRLDALVDDSLLETTQAGMMVWDLTDDSLLYSRNARQLLRPASTMKLLTAVTALDRLGTDYKFKTSLYYRGTISQGQLRGDLICRGGMDPLFSRKDMLAFVQAVKQQGVRSISGRVIVDTSMKESEKWGEGWCWDDDNPELTPLLIEGKGNFGATLLRELRAAGVSTGVGSVITGGVPRDAKLLITRTHTIAEVLKPMMKESDNLCAESTFYQVAASTGKRPATAKDGQEVERDLIEKLGLQGDTYRLADGSGLSLYNYVSAELLCMLLRHAWRSPSIHEALLPALPIAGVDGTLKDRMKKTAAAGNVLAKTGTLSGISSLAGYCTSFDGHDLCFSIINQGVMHNVDGKNFQNRVCTVLCETPCSY